MDWTNWMNINRINKYIQFPIEIFTVSIFINFAIRRYQTLQGFDFDWETS